MVDTKVDKTLRTRTTGSAYKRPNFATEFKRELVEQTFEPGASVALIARRNEVNANLLFKWRRLYLAGAYGLPTRAEHAVSKLDCEEPALLPVSIVAETPAPAVTINADAPLLENVCEVEFDRARLRIRGDVSPTTLRLLIRELSR
jgi:transposase